jgi:hypothetical protein
VAVVVHSLYGGGGHSDDGNSSGEVVEMVKIWRLWL